jgi:ankyrin repeat protein
MSKMKRFSICVFLFAAGFMLIAANAQQFPPKAILAASYKGDIRAVKMLLTKHPDKSMRDSFGRTALHLAMFQKNPALIKLLLDKGYDVNARCSGNGATPLHDAVSANNVEGAKLLIRYGANRNIRNAQGLTPLQEARRDGSQVMIQLLSQSRPL